MSRKPTAPPAPPRSASVGSLIRQAREALRHPERGEITIEALAKAVSAKGDNFRHVRMDAAKLAAIEAGTVVPTTDELERLAVKLGRDLPELTRGPLRELRPQEHMAIRSSINRSQGGHPVATSDPQVRTNISINLRSYREAIGLSQSEVARAIDISQSNVNNHENPAWKNSPSADTLARYAKLYRCTVEDLQAPPRPIVRAKLSGDLGPLTDEEKDAFLRAVEERMSTELVRAIAAEQRKMSRRR